MDAKLVICAENASIDGQTNKLSLFSVIEEVSAIGFPGLIPSISLVLVFTKTPSETEKVSLRIEAKMNGKKLFELPLKASFQGKNRLRVVSNVQGVAVSEPGRLTFSVHKKTKELGAWSIDVLQLAQPQIMPPTMQLSGASVVSRATAAPKKKAKRKKKA